jgi:hypothetical protein
MLSAKLLLPIILQTSIYLRINKMYILIHDINFMLLYGIVNELLY